jgi:SAM-dependent methyltransferase
MTEQEFAVMEEQRNLYDYVYQTATGYGGGFHGSPVLDYVDNLEFEDILDIGCGLGHFCSAMLDRGKRAVGVDISRIAIEKARERDPRLCITCGSIPGFVNDHQFDLVTCFDVLEHLPVILVERGLTALRDYGKRCVMGIAWSGSRVAGKVLHLCVRPETWWVGKLHEIFRVVEKIRDKPRGRGAFFCCE